VVERLKLEGIMKKVLVTGGSGMVGYEMKRMYPEFHYPTHSELDLESENEVRSFLEKNQFDTALHIAARVGGVADNTNHVADFFSMNMSMNRNFLECCHRAGVKKVVSILSTCVYPDAAFVRYPLTEDQLHLGPPHPSNFGYAYAKRMLDVQSRALRAQYGCNFITLIPNNLYGINDRFDLQSGHVIPSLIRKFYESKISGDCNVVCWGSGDPEREFTYSRDIASIIVWAAENYDEPEPLNIGNVQSITIKKLAEMISDEVGFEGEIVWNTSAPDGQLRKPSSNRKLIDHGWSGSYTPLEVGLKETVDWFKSTYPNVRGVDVRSS
jgi:GDP-L-fucose synthase